jgi:hypothetical protein
MGVMAGGGAVPVDVEGRVTACAGRWAVHALLASGCVSRPAGVLCGPSRRVASIASPTTVYELSQCHMHMGVNCDAYLRSTVPKLA